MASWRASGSILEPGPRFWRAQASSLKAPGSIVEPSGLLPSFGYASHIQQHHLTNVGQSRALGSFLFCSSLPQRPGQTKAFLKKQSLPALIIPPLISICQCIHLCIQLMHIKPQRPCQSLGGGGVPPRGPSMELLKKSRFLVFF